MEKKMETTNYCWSYKGCYNDIFLHSLLTIGQEMENTIVFRAYDRGDFVIRFSLGIARVTLRAIGVVNLLARSP